MPESSSQPVPSFADDFHCGLWMPLVQKYLPSILVDDDAFAKIDAMASRLPGTVQGAIEVRLGAEPAPVDFSVRIGNAKAARSLAPYVHPEHVRDFLRGWAEDPDPRVPFLWAEFDLDRPMDELQPIFIVRTDGGDGPTVDWVLQDLLRETLGVEPPEAQKATVRRALETVPKHGTLVYVFDLRCRGSDTLRLDFYGLHPNDMQTTLRDLGRPDLAAALEKAGELAADATRFHFNFDVDTDGEILPRLGIEASYPVFGRRGSKWEDLLDTLVSAGLCTAEKKEAVLDWPGYTARGAEPELWPLGADGPEGFLIRSLSHVKLVCRPDHEPEAKIYLLFGRQVRNAEGKLMIATD